ncbi:SAM-dependent methyltransferase [Oscillatoria sp. FACHB-1406]|uniref:SAM-dependent methyltransferase n=1 Tax=Oscillatoria sp. FACHB-1406 TaxID=2692846 RepID=UPI00168898EB|nr:SAM-dependent methyltransferase [Oscillatoria sp. FACHB-1406]MBD2578494.1 methyltransferase domain-containing protein [Oscillatoria sp. FACHB-1406]
MTIERSLSADYFDNLYSADPDPWKFETSAYEAQKYEATIAALNRDRYPSALEIGCSIGVLTEKLAARCDKLLSLDVSSLALEKAIDRCQNSPHVRFQVLNVPKQFPDETFDLIVVSEVGYYWCWEDLKLAQEKIYSSLTPKGQLLLVHWIHDAPDYPLRGNHVHDSFQEFAAGRLHQCTSQRTDNYRLDLYEKIE